MHYPVCGGFCQNYFENPCSKHGLNRKALQPGKSRKDPTQILWHAWHATKHAAMPACHR